MAGRGEWSGMGGRYSFDEQHESDGWMAIRGTNVACLIVVTRQEHGHSCSPSQSSTEWTKPDVDSKLCYEDEMGG